MNTYWTKKVKENQWTDLTYVDIKLCFDFDLCTEELPFIMYPETL